MAQVGVSRSTTALPRFGSRPSPGGARLPPSGPNPVPVDGRQVRQAAEKRTLRMSAMGG